MYTFKKFLKSKKDNELNEQYENIGESVQVTLQDGTTYTETSTFSFELIPQMSTIEVDDVQGDIVEGDMMYLNFYLSNGDQINVIGDWNKSVPNRSSRAKGPGILFEHVTKGDTYFLDMNYYNELVSGLGGGKVTPRDNFAVIPGNLWGAVIQQLFYRDMNVKTTYMNRKTQSLKIDLRKFIKVV